MDKLYQVFISSTYTDLVKERQAVANALAKAGYFVSGMEFFPASSVQQLDYIKRLIDRCDYYVLIVAGRYGSLNNEGISYTEAEYRYAKSIGKPILVFLRKDIESIPRKDTENDPKISQKLADFRAEVQKDRIIRFWDSASELETAVAISVPQEVNLNPQMGWVRGDHAADPKLLEELLHLRAENARLITLTQDQNSGEGFPPELEGPDDVTNLTVTHWALSAYNGQRQSKEKTDKFEKTETQTVTWGTIFLSIYHKLSLGEAKEEDIATNKKNVEYITTIYTPPEGYKILESRTNIHNIRQIATQFAALGLISLSFEESTQNLGHLSFSHKIPLWQITDKGRRFALRRLAKRRISENG